MFFGEKILKEIPFKLQHNKQNYQNITLTNVSLDLKSAKAELYLKVNNKNILVCQLDRQANVLQTNLNVLVDLKDLPQLISQSGDVYVCGYFNQKQEENSTNLYKPSDELINTNKKNNQLSKVYLTETKNAAEEKTSGKEESEQKKNTQKYVLQTPTTTRKSSRLSTRRAVPVEKQVEKQQKKQLPKASKKQQKQVKKEQKTGHMLKNGRYSLKSLLQNIDDDDDDDQDEQFSDASDEDESEDDSEFDEDEVEQEQQASSKSKKRKQQERSEKQQKRYQTGQQQTNKEDIKTDIVPRSHLSQTLQIGQQQDNGKKQLNAEQFQEKWPQISQSQFQKQANERQQKISELASRIKCPTKMPTI